MTRGWTMMDIGKRIERGLTLAALLRATLTTVRPDEAEQTITESALVACESAVIYRRLNLGRVSVAAVTDLVLLDEDNPRSLIYQLDRLAADVRSLPGASDRRGFSVWLSGSGPGCDARIPPIWSGG